MLDANERLQELLKQRGWSAYRLAKNCGLSESTISNIIRRNAVPSISTLEIICEGFGITMAQFFTDGDMVEITPDVKELINCWAALSPNQKDSVLRLIKTMNQD